MGINLKRNVFKRIVLVILVIITFNIMCPPQVEASTFLGAAGGAIIDTIFDFLVFLGDSVIDILQENFITPSPAIKPATAKEFSTFDMGHFGWLICGIIFAVVGITAIFTGGLSLPVIGGLLIPMAVGGLATTVIAGANLIEGLKGDFDIPTIVYTPYTIFSGQIPAFDINFIHPTQKSTVGESKFTSVDLGIGDVLDYGVVIKTHDWGKNQPPHNDLYNNTNINSILQKFEVSLGEDTNPSEVDEEAVKTSIITWESGGTKYKLIWQKIDGGPHDENIAINTAKGYTTWDFKKTWIVSSFSNDTEEISNLVAIDGARTWIPEGEIVRGTWTAEYEEYVSMDPETFVFNTGSDVFSKEYTEIVQLDKSNDKDMEYQWTNNSGTYKIKYHDDRLFDYGIPPKGYAEWTGYVLCTKGAIGTYESTAGILQPAIATWYNALQKITIVILLSMLIYVGIKIMITSASAEKAKYKKYFIDWVAALCLLFVLHYIMIFILTMSTGLTKLFLVSPETLIAEELPTETKVDGKELTSMLAGEKTYDDSQNPINVTSVNGVKLKDRKSNMDG